ncbi:MAG: hypothetical protein AAF328_06935 [Planctomycetota bacterium]
MSDLISGHRLRSIAFGMVSLFAVGLSMGCQSTPKNPAASLKQAWNDLVGQFYTADGQLRAPIDAATAGVSPVYEEALDLDEVRERLAAVELPAGGEELDSQGLGQLTVSPAGRQQIRASLVNFPGPVAVTQERDDICWAACVEMVERYQRGRAVDQLDIVEAVMGPGLEKVPTGQNYGNLYEIVKAMNPAAVSEDGKTDYLLLQTLQLTRTNSETAIYNGAKQLQRYMQHFVGTEEMLAALSRGEPVIVGLRLPGENLPGGTADTPDFGHALVLHAADFTALSEHASSERDFLALERKLGHALKAADFLFTQAPAEENSALGNATDAALERLKDGGSMIKGFFTDDGLDRDGWLALTRVYLTDPWDKQGYAPTTQMLGESFRDRLLFAMTYRVARQVSPQVEIQHEEAKQIIQELGS